MYVIFELIRCPRFYKVEKKVFLAIFFFLAIFLHFIFYHILYSGISFNPKPQATDLSVHLNFSRTHAWRYYPIKIKYIICGANDHVYVKY